jgi:hypothetical protein
MEHRGYTGTVEYDRVDGFFYGRVLDIDDSVYYEAVSEERLEAAFRDAVDEYLDQCWACEQEPQRPRSAVDTEDADRPAVQVIEAGPEVLSGPASNRPPISAALPPAELRDHEHVHGTLAAAHLEAHRLAGMQPGEEAARARLRERPSRDAQQHVSRADAAALGGGAGNHGLHADGLGGVPAPVAVLLPPATVAAVQLHPEVHARPVG